ncbi:RDD family protein [Allobranchiibius sp. CTAmp26]|uniref:RDD family protein n=1 Tax=Allobranchiibius sp. CTAmp26 TaxID=2815214 RepID=UPI0027DD786F|nr:RDD family protein [Allobranchiibius sp. CTAmp26]
MVSPQSSPPTDPAADAGWPGKRFGCAEEGVTSVARLSPRVIALVIDWALCSVIAAGLLGYRWGGSGSSGFAPLLVFAVENILLVGVAGSTIGHWIVGVRVTRLDGAVAGPVAAIIRAVLLCVVIPALIFDTDQRGLHDKLARTILVRTR